MVVMIKSKPDRIVEEGQTSEKKRAGLTTTTSVSVSDEFRELIDNYNLSPTEVFRRGVAVTLAGLGVRPYNTKMNLMRLEAIKKKLELDKLLELADKLQDASNIIKEILETTQ